MVNNPKFDEAGARGKDGKGIVRSKQADSLVGCMSSLGTSTPIGGVCWSNLV